MSSVQSLLLLVEKTVTVIYPYDGKLDDELAMKPGDVITVDDWDISDDWARGTLNGKTGLFYKAFTKPSSEVPSPDDFKLKEVRGKPKRYEATYKGREYILKEKLDEVECIICHELADNVHQTSCCGSTICLQCAKTWKAKRNSCPHCRKQPLKFVEDPKTQRRITGAAVYCPNYCFGCDWVNTFGRVTQHLEADCDYEGTECPKCKEVLPKKFIEKHNHLLCLRRNEVCPCCGACRMYGSSWFSSLLTYNAIISSHHCKCPKWPTRCPSS